MAEKIVGRRETIVYHQVNEETGLFSSNVSNSEILTDHNILSNKKRVYTSIALADIFQKVVYTTIITSFVLYAYTYLQCGPEYALLAYFIFSSISWITASFVNLIDDIIPKHRAIVFGFLIFIIGLSALTGISANITKNDSYLKYVSMGMLYIVCLGESCCKTLIGEFGHDQFAKTQLLQHLQVYSDRLYWVGHICALFLIAFLLGMVEFANFEIGYGLSCVVLCAGLMCFFIGWSKFTAPEEQKGNRLKSLFSMIKEAKRIQVEFQKRSRANGKFDAPFGTKGMAQHWLDYARIKFGGSFSDNLVNEAISMFKMVAIFFSFIPYWVCNAQGYSTFIYQAFHLNTSLGSVTLAVSWAALVNIIAVLFFVKLLEKLVYPALRRNGKQFTTKWRIISGMICASISMILAGTLQYFIHSEANLGRTLVHNVGRAEFLYVPNVHMLWAIPQFVFLGISEMLVGLTGLGLACKLCPDNFQKLVTSMYYIMVAMGNIISMVFIAAGVFPSKNLLGNNSAIVYFFSLAVLAVFGIVIFVAILSRQEQHIYVIPQPGPVQENPHEIL